jgi:hypothetical protein
MIETYKKELADRLLRGASVRVKEHLISQRLLGKKESDWISGYLFEEDIKFLESKYGRIKVSPESGEYFYKCIYENPILSIL